MKSKLTMKHRHLKNKVSLFIYSIVAAVSITGSIMPLTVFANMNQYDEYVYSHAVVTQTYEYISAAGGTTTASPKRMGLKYRIIVHLDGVYNGEFVFIATSSTNWSSQKYDISYINCYTDEYATVLGTDLAQQVKFNGTSYFEINIIIWTENGSLQYAPLPSFVKLTGVDFDEFTNLSQLTQSEVQTMINIKNAIYDIKAYTDQIEPYILQCEGDLSNIASRLNDVYNRQNVSNNILTDIKNILSNMDFTTTPAEQTELQTFNTQNQTVQNIQSNLINHLTDTVDGTRTTPQYLQYQLVDNRDLQSYHYLNTLYSAINWPPITSGLFVQILRLIFMFIIIGVILG